jgi:xylan 1,4-beta-xylosidase
VQDGPVEVVVDAASVRGELSRPWRSIGFDEINWTYTPSGRELLAALGQLGDGPYLVRSHYMFCSGSGFGLPHWGAGNVYHERADGSWFADFRILDRVYDAVVEAGHRPLVELGFTPRALVPPEAAGRFAFEPGSPTQYSAYEAGLWSYPPRSLQRWAELVQATVEHCAGRYGQARVAEWVFECWNEPDIGYWRGTPDEYCELYEATARAVKAGSAQASVGGPATTGDVVPDGPVAARGPAFLESFLEHCIARNAPLDFVSFHTKGSFFRPVRTYLPHGAPAPARQSPSTPKMLREIDRGLRLVGERPALGDLPCLIDECDPSVPAHYGRYDNPNFDFRNTEYYPVFQCNLMKKLIDLEALAGRVIGAATAWAFYVEAERCFEGTRSLATYGGLAKPVLNAYRMLARLGRWRLAASSGAASTVASLLEQPSAPEEVDVLAARAEDGRCDILVWRHRDDQHDAPRDERSVRLHVRGLDDGRAVAVRQWRIDHRHSNSYRRWQELGSPDYPDQDQLDELRAVSGLERFGPERAVVPEDGAAVLELSLPLPAVSLVEIAAT